LDSSTSKASNNNLALKLEEASYNTPSPEQVPISNENSSPLIRKLEVPQLEKETDYHKDISDLRTEQDELLAKMMTNPKNRDNGSSDNYSSSDSSSSYGDNFRPKAVTDTKPRKIMSNLSHQNFLLDNADDEDEEKDLHNSSIVDNI
jgi:hypothetical protein